MESTQEDVTDSHTRDFPLQSGESDQDENANNHSLHEPMHVSQQQMASVSEMKRHEQTLFESSDSVDPLIRVHQTEAIDKEFIHTSTIVAESFDGNTSFHNEQTSSTDPTIPVLPLEDKNDLQILDNQHTSCQSLETRPQSNGDDLLNTSNENELSHSNSITIGNEHVPNAQDVRRELEEEDKQVSVPTQHGMQQMEFDELLQASLIMASERQEPNTQDPGSDHSDGALSDSQDFSSHGDQQGSPSDDMMDESSLAESRDASNSDGGNPHVRRSSRERKPTRKLSGTKSKSGSNTKAVKVYCICRKPYSQGDMMVACDKCDDWFHIKCVGLSDHEARELPEYNCPACIGTMTNIKIEESQSNQDSNPTAAALVLVEAVENSSLEKKPEPNLDSGPKCVREGCHQNALPIYDNLFCSSDCYVLGYNSYIKRKVFAEAVAQSNGKTKADAPDSDKEKDKPKKEKQSVEIEKPQTNSLPKESIASPKQQNSKISSSASSAAASPQQKALASLQTPVVDGNPFLKKLRDGAIRSIEEALSCGGVHETPTEKVREIEETLHQVYAHDMKQYQIQARHVAMFLKKPLNTQMRSDVLRGELKPAQLAKMTTSEFFALELKYAKNRSSNMIDDADEIDDGKANQDRAKTNELLNEDEEEQIVKATLEKMKQEEEREKSIKLQRLKELQELERMAKERHRQQILKSQSRQNPGGARLLNIPMKPQPDNPSPSTPSSHISPQTPVPQQLSIAPQSSLPPTVLSPPQGSPHGPAGQYGPDRGNKVQDNASPQRWDEMERNRGYRGPENPHLERGYSRDLAREPVREPIRDYTRMHPHEHEQPRDWTRDRDRDRDRERDRDRDRERGNERDWNRGPPADRDRHWDNDHKSQWGRPHSWSKEYERNLPSARHERLPPDSFNDGQAGWKSQYGSEPNYGQRTISQQLPPPPPPLHQVDNHSRSFGASDPHRYNHHPSATHSTTQPFPNRPLGAPQNSFPSGHNPHLYAPQHSPNSFPNSHGGTSAPVTPPPSFPNHPLQGHPTFQHQHQHQHQHQATPPPPPPSIPPKTTYQQQHHHHSTQGFNQQKEFSSSIPPSAFVPHSGHHTAGPQTHFPFTERQSHAPEKSILPISHVTNHSARAAAPNQPVHSADKSPMVWKGSVTNSSVQSFQLAAFQVSGPPVQAGMFPEELEVVGRVDLSNLGKFFADLDGSSSRHKAVLFFLPFSDDDEPMAKRFSDSFSQKQRAAVIKTISKELEIYIVPPTNTSASLLGPQGPLCGVVVWRKAMSFGPPLHSVPLADTV